MIQCGIKVWVIDPWYLVVKKGQSLDLKYKEVILVCAGDEMRLHRLDCCWQDGPLKLQNSIAHVHFAQVAKVMSALISVWCQKGLKSELWCQQVTGLFMTLCLHPPFCSFCHQPHIQGSSREVIAVCAGLTVKAGTKVICYWCPV